MDSFTRDLRGEGDLVHRHPNMDTWHWLDERLKLPRPIQEDIKTTYPHYEKLKLRLQKFTTGQVERVLKSHPGTLLTVLLTYCDFSRSAGGPFLSAWGPDNNAYRDHYWCDFAQVIDGVDGEPIKTLALDLQGWILQTWGFKSTVTDNKTPPKGEIFSNVTILVELDKSVLPQ